MTLRKTTVLVLCIALAGLVGCGSGGVDENKPMSEVRAEAQGMSAADLQKQAEAYKAAIEAKTPEIEELQAKVKEIPLAEILGDEAKTLKADIDKLTGSIKALKERMAVYVEELRKQDGDVSGFEM